MFKTIGVLGTGMVGRAHAARLAGLGVEVLLGTRDVEKALAVTETDQMGNGPLKEWIAANPSVTLVPFAEAAAAEMVINALNGAVSVEVLSDLSDELVGKILVDIANPLDFSNGMPATLFVSNTDSLGEQIQAALPKTHVVKTLNTVNAFIQVDPQQLQNGDHHIFISANDVEAKATVVNFLKEQYGWKEVIDLGDITTARGTEMYLPLWLRLYAVQGPQFNIKIVQ